MVDTAAAEREARAAAAAKSAAIAAHGEAALKKAGTYFRNEFSPGSADLYVANVNFENVVTIPFEGWSGRYRTEGKVILQILSRRMGPPAQSTTSYFELFTDQSGDGPIQVGSVSRKN